jgi:hypothetical protein
VLTVDRQDADVLLPRVRHHDLAGHDEDLFAGDSDIFPGVNRG